MKHLEENSETYFNHLKFAITVGLTLLVRGGIFILHGLFPVCDIPKGLDLGGTCDKLDEWCSHVKQRTSKKDL